MENDEIAQIQRNKELVAKSGGNTVKRLAIGVAVLLIFVAAQYLPEHSLPDALETMPVRFAAFMAVALYFCVVIIFQKSDENKARAYEKTIFEKYKSEHDISLFYNGLFSSDFIQKAMAYGVEFEMYLQDGRPVSGGFFWVSRNVVKLDSISIGNVNYEVKYTGLSDKEISLNGTVVAVYKNGKTQVNGHTYEISRDSIQDERGRVIAFGGQENLFYHYIDMPAKSTKEDSIAIAIAFVASWYH